MILHASELTLSAVIEEKRQINSTGLGSALHSQSWWENGNVSVVHHLSQFGVLVWHWTLQTVTEMHLSNGWSDMYWSTYLWRWRGGATGRALDLWSTGCGFKSYSCQCNNFGQVVHTYVPPSPSSITWYQPWGDDAHYHQTQLLWKANANSYVLLSNGAICSNLEWP